MVMVVYIIYAMVIILFIALLVYLTVSLRQEPTSAMDSIIDANGESKNSVGQINNESDNITNEGIIFNGNFPFPIYIINLDRKPERFIYVKEQLDKMGITNYERISAVDGFNLTQKELEDFGLTPELSERKGIAGCAASHIKIWKHIAENKLGWCLILEDDAHFHPDFLKLFEKYWVNVPKNAKIIYPGYCANKEVEESSKSVIEKGVMCTQAYMLSSDGAQYLLNNVFPLENPIDITILTHFNNNFGSYIFNGNISMDGIRPNDYKESNGRRCMFNGIIYQNHEEQGSTIHGPETVY